MVKLSTNEIIVGNLYESLEYIAAAVQVAHGCAIKDVTTKRPAFGHAGLVILPLAWGRQGSPRGHVLLGSNTVA